MFRRILPVIAASVLVACGGGDDPGAALPTATPAPTAAPSSAPSSSSAATGTDQAPAPAALQFTAPLVGGGDIELGSLAGRPVLLWFWAPW